MLTTEAGDGPPMSYRWSARRMHPAILLYVLLIFVGFMALAWFGFHSSSGVKALALGAIGYGVALVPAVLGRIEYELDGTGVRQRAVDRRKEGAFRETFRWDDLDHVVPMRHGFRYYRHLSEPNALRRFWKTQISDAYSGEVHLETSQRAKVLEMVGARAEVRGTVRPAAPARGGPETP